LNKKAFFFQESNLLLPADFPDSRVGEYLSLELAGEFNNPDIFEIPSLADPAASGEILINAVSVSPGNTLSANWKSVPVRQILSMFSIEGGEKTVSGKPVSDILRACHIAQWRRDSRFCGTCGAKNSDARGQTHRQCSQCGRLEFPRICPASIVIITDDENRILLAHNKRFKAGVYSLISGYNEAGESLEETVAREVREEVNIEVKDIEYVKSQPWPFPNSLMVGYKARFAGGVLKPDGEEIEDAGWFAKDNLPALPGEGSLARVLINNWLNNK